jgi:hypothetical protein
MRTPIFIRPLTEDEQQHIQKGLRSSAAFVLRRCQILTASARGERAAAIARQLGCDDQTVRNVIHGFNASGLAVLQKGSSRPHRLRTSFTQEGAERLKDEARIAAHVILAKSAAPGPWHWPPRSVSSRGLSRPRSPTKACAAPSNDSKPTGSALNTPITSPDPHYLLKKTARDRLIAWTSRQVGWAIGFLDEVWWSRFALPRIHAWQDEDHAVHLVEQCWQKGDPDPKALACYGILWQRGPAEEPIRDQMSLRFVTGRPVSDITTQFLQWGCEQVQAQGKTAWLLIWDNASWHVSKLVRTWIRQHTAQVKAEGKGVRILPCFLPTKSPWLNPIEPKWVHGKRAVVEPNGLLSAHQLAQRVCSHFGCSYEPHLVIPEKVA